MWEKKICCNQFGGHGPPWPPRIRQCRQQMKAGERRWSCSVPRPESDSSAHARWAAWCYHGDVSDCRPNCDWKLAEASQWTAWKTSEQNTIHEAGLSQFQLCTILHARKLPTDRLADIARRSFLRTAVIVHVPDLRASPIHMPPRAKLWLVRCRQTSMYASGDQRTLVVLAMGSDGMFLNWVGRERSHCLALGLPTVPYFPGCPVFQPMCPASRRWPTRDA